MYRLILGLVVLTVACDSPTEPEEARRLGYNPEIVAPDTVSAGETFTVRVVTWDTGCYKAGGVDVMQAENVVTIVPYHVRNEEVGTCTLIANFSFEHELRIRFNAVGPGRLMVVGRQIGGVAAESWVVHHDVVVQ